MAKNHFNQNQLIIDFDVIEKELFLNGNIQNIRHMLPKLYNHQHEDVSKAELRFQIGKGYLFTNGTGTGKTFVGLGVAYRFYIQDKKNILIVVPTEKKCTDWIEDGELIGLPIYQLQGTKDKGTNAVVTTYANFYQNDALNQIKWDLIIYDESHYLNQNEKGKETVYIDKHKQLANLPSKARDKADYLVKMEKPEYDYDAKEFDYKNYYALNIQYKKEHLKVVKELVEYTKVLFLSATPFAYHKSIKYADGCLFEIEEKIEKERNNGVSYNEAIGLDDFLIKNFGYRMRYNKLTIPETGVDVNLLERNFFEKLKEEGVMSTRILELEYDYSRQFVTVDSKLGEFINSGIELFYDTNFHKEFPILSKLFGKKYNYNYVNQLLECIKAKEVHERIKIHLNMNRKVVIFHNYNNSTLEHPFRFDPYVLLTAEEKWKIGELNSEILKYKNTYPNYWNLDLSGLKNTREAILEHFPHARQYNGTINKKLRSKNIDDFNSDLSGTNILIVQIKAGREGISLHDKSGIYKRVLINMGLPTAPTEAIQSEGRIYREGLKSNAIYEYVTLQTNFERFAFGTKIAERSRTAENLAMGNLARDLESAFKEGYIDSNYHLPSEEQGIGGKEKDRFENTISIFDKAKTYYWSRGKRNSKNKSKEGIDYFATPEPLGYKIIEWINPQPDEKGLEPSAGHGAISRWFPQNTINHFIEPSLNLAGELAINSFGTIKNDTFENHSIINKYQFIAMNPPFGVSGKTAMEHISKACIKHAGTKFRLIAIIPGGPSMNKRLEEFFNSELGRNFIMLWQIRLPSIVFERAGTNIACKIIKIVYKSPLHEFYNTKKIDLSYLQTINDFFNEIEYLEI